MSKQITEDDIRKALEELWDKEDEEELIIYTHSPELLKMFQDALTVQIRLDMAKKGTKGGKKIKY